MVFKTTTHLSEIIEASQKEPVIIFKFSNICGTSSRLKEEIEKVLENKKKIPIIYLVTVQTQRNLSNKIAEFFEIQHESPQIIKIENGKSLYTESHFRIKLNDFLNS